MGRRPECEQCEPEDRKNEGYLCEKVKAADGLKVRCIHEGSVLKLNVLRYYLKIFCGAMKNQLGGQHCFIDLFSGPGLCHNKDAEFINNQDEKSEIFLPGSALIALDQTPAFAKYVFVDINKDTSDILYKRCKKQFHHLIDRIEFVNEDANAVTIGRFQDNFGITVVFIDPNGLDIQFDTIYRLSKQRSMDLIINFSILDLKRNEDNYRQGNDKADLFFGTNKWRNTQKREWLKLYRSQLKLLGFRAIENEDECVITVPGKSNAPIYHLIYASKNKRGLDFWRKTKKKFLQPDIMDRIQ